MKVKNPSTGNFEEVYVKALDSLPVGSEIDFTGSASDIPAGWEQVDTPINIITAYLDSNYTIVNNSTTEYIKNFVLKDSVGTKLTIENGVIKIGNGVSKVKVSYSALSKATSSATRTFTYLMHNNSDITQDSHYYSSTNEQISISKNPMIVNVSPGDTFYLAVYGASGNQIYGGSRFNWTIITVEVVE